MHSTVEYSTVQYHIQFSIQLNTVQYSTVHFNIVEGHLLYGQFSIQLNTVQYSTVHFNIVEGHLLYGGRLVIDKDSTSDFSLDLISILKFYLRTIYFGFETSSGLSVK